MPHPSRRKGDRVERELVHLHQALGLNCCRVPLSGAVGGEFSGDLRLHLVGHQLRAEVKARRNGMKTLIDWLADNDLLFVRLDQQQPLVVLPWRTWTRLLQAMGADAHVE